ncbi:MAG: serine protease spb1, partial [Bdellovibrio sp.]
MKAFLFITLSLLSPSTWAASCCGGGFSIPALILGDDKAQWTSTFSSSHVSDEVLADEKWLRRQDNNQTYTLKLEAATLLSDTWQAGFSLPLLLRS